MRLTVTTICFVFVFAATVSASDSKEFKKNHVEISISRGFGFWNPVDDPWPQITYDLRLNKYLEIGLGVAYMKYWYLSVLGDSRYRRWMIPATAGFVVEHKKSIWIVKAGAACSVYEWIDGQRSYPDPSVGPGDNNGIFLSPIAALGYRHELPFGFSVAGLIRGEIRPLIISPSIALGYSF